MTRHEEKSIEATRLATPGGLEVNLLNLGATLQSIKVPTSNGAVEVLQGYPDIEDYRDNRSYFGSTIGRYAGRISDARFTLNGKRYELDRNDPEHGHCLHGGSRGFNSHFWSQTVDDGGQWVNYETVSEDGDQGFPGRLEVETRYSLAGPMSLQIDYRARADRDTVLNLTNHAYFNLNGDGSCIENHEVWINSDLYLPLKPDMTPTGDIRAVNGTIFDFRNKVRLADRLGRNKRQLRIAGGYDHFFLLNKAMKYPAIAATVSSPETGIRAKFYSARPGVQFYTGNHLASPFKHRSGLCMEFQNAPNAPNVDGFPSPVLEAGQDYHRQLILEFEAV
jgi:aldose 1-epimerase